MRLSEFEKYKVLRPLFGDVEYDDSMPIIKKDNFDDINWNTIDIVNFKSSKNIKRSETTIVEMFNYDHVLMGLWNNPYNHMIRFKNYLAIATPDFSIYPGMNKYDIEHNVYKNRWLGCTWQNLGIKVIPTISWGDESTYDIVFKGIEKESVVMISTLGCFKNKAFFLKGYDEMLRRIKPQLIIVVGKIIEGMTGNIIPFDYTDTFSKKDEYEQLKLFEMDRILRINAGDDIYG